MDLPPILLSVISSLFTMWTNYHSFVSVLITFSFQKLRNFVKFYTFWCPNLPSFDNEEKERHGQRQKSKWSGKKNRFHLSFFSPTFSKLQRRVEPNFKNPPKIILCKTFVKLPFDMNEVIEMTGNGNHVNLLKVARKN